MKYLSVLAIGLVIPALVGCASSSKKLNKISPGLTKDEVLVILGRPHSTSAQGETEYLSYNLINKGGGDLREYTVKLVHGAVESFGERTDYGTARWLGTNSPAKN